MPGAAGAQSPKPPPATLVRALAGRRVAEVRRRGKYLLLMLDDGRHSWFTWA